MQIHLFNFKSGFTLTELVVFLFYSMFTSDKINKMPSASTDTGHDEDDDDGISLSRSTGKSLILLHAIYLLVYFPVIALSKLSIELRECYFFYKKFNAIFLPWWCSLYYIYRRIGMGSPM